MQEIWKNIKGFSKYQISNFGNVRKINTDKQIKSAKIIGKLKRKLTLKQAYEIRKKSKNNYKKRISKRIWSFIICYR